jgi:hypothetical protein
MVVDFSQVRRAPKAQPKSGGVGRMRGGYSLPPIELPGLSKPQIQAIKVAAKKSGFKPNRSVGNIKTPGGFNQKAVPGRAFSSQGAWMAAAMASDQLMNARNVDQENQQFWEIADQIKSVVSMGATIFGGPVVGAITDVITGGIAAIVERNKKEGERIVEYERYMDELKKQGKGGVTFSAWDKWDKEKAGKEEEEEEDEAVLCQTVTEDMLNGQTLEEYMASEGVVEEPVKAKGVGSEFPPGVKEYKPGEEDKRWEVSETGGYGGTREAYQPTPEEKAEQERKIKEREELGGSRFENM